MRRTLNWKLLLWTLGILILLGVVTHVVHSIQIRRNAGSLLAHADQLVSAEGAKDSGDLDRALMYYQHYLAFEPTDTAARAKYALALDRHADNPSEWLRVVLTFEQVLQQDPKRKDVRFRLVHNLVHLQRYREAAAHAQTLLPQWDNQAEIEQILGWCYGMSGDYAKAATSFAKSIELDPHRLDSYVQLTDVLQNYLDKPEEAAAAMDNLVKANDKSFEAYLLRSKFLHQRNQMAEAERDLKKALELAGNEPTVLIAAADWAQAKGDVAKARGLLLQGRKQDPRNLAVVKALTGLEIRAGKRDEAVSLLNATLKDMPKAYELQVLLADLLIDEGKLEQAEAKIQELNDAHIPAAFTDFLGARLAIAKRQWAEALTLLERARPELGNNTQWGSRLQGLLGICYHHVGDFDQELTAFRRAATLEPGWTLARFGLGSALIDNGLLDEALTELLFIQNAADVPPDVWVAMARALVYRNMLRPENLRNWVEVDKALARAEQATPKSSDIPWLRAEVLAAQKNYHTANELLTKATAAQPEKMLFWAARANLAARQNQWSEASALLDQAEKQAGDGLELRLARCRIWSGEGTAAARKGLEGLANNLEALPAAARSRILRELADTWVRLGDTGKAVALWQRLAREQPRDLHSRFALFENALHSNQLDRARTLLADLRTLEGEQGKLWRLGTAALLVHEADGNRQKLDNARKALEQLARRHKQWGRIPLLQARIDEREGNLDKAVDGYLQAVELGERQPSTLVRTLQLLTYFQRYLEAEQIFHKVAEQMVPSPELLRLGADIALANQNAEAALRLAGQAVGAAERDYRDELWLGRIYHGAGADAKAEAAFRHAVALAPHTPETWIALVEQLARMGKRDAALAEVALAKEKVSRRLALFTQARCYEKMGLVDEAETCYRQGLNDAAEDFVFLAHAADFFRNTDQQLKAEPFLVKLLQPGAGTPADYVNRARRQLAFVLATQGGANYQKAMDLVEGNVRSRPNNPVELRARAFVQATQASQRSQAIQVFEDTRRRQPLSGDEQFQLAQLYDAAGDQARTEEQLLALRAAQPENPQWLAFFIRQLIKRDELRQAREHLQKLERLEPRSPRTLHLKSLL